VLIEKHELELRDCDPENEEARVEHVLSRYVLNVNTPFVQEYFVEVMLEAEMHFVPS
jgi:hypothetical protein